jgi:hypothetical protein
MYLDVKVRLSNKFCGRHLVIDLNGKRTPVFLFSKPKKGRASLGVHPKLYVQLASKTPYFGGGFRGSTDCKGN